MICPKCGFNIVRSTKDERAQKIAFSFIDNGVSLRDTEKALKQMGYDISFSTLSRINRARKHNKPEASDE